MIQDYLDTTPRKVGQVVVFPATLIGLYQRHAGCVGPRWFVRVDNGRDVLTMLDYYNENDARVAFRAEINTQRRRGEDG